jgi:hypothetical protein
MLNMKLHNLVLAGVAAAALSVFTGVALADDAPAAAAPAVTPAPAAEPAAEQAAEVEEEDEEEVELTYQQQAQLLVDTIIEDYTVRMAALQAIIDMRDDTIAGDNDTIKKRDANIKLLTATMKAAQRVDKELRPIVTAMADGDVKTSALDVLDRLITSIDKFNAAQ